MALTEGIIFGLIAMSSWGISDFFLKKATDKIGYQRSLFWINFVMMIPFLLYFFISGVNFGNIQNFLPLLLISAALDFSSAFFFYKAAQKGKISIIGPVQSAWIIITVALSLIFLKEVLTQLQAVGIGVTILGILLVAFRYSDIRKMSFKKLLPGIPEDVISLIFVGFNMVIIGFLVSKMGWFAPLFFIRIITPVIAFSYLITKKVGFSFGGNMKITKINVFLSGITSVVGFISYGMGVSLEQVAIVASVTATYPLATVILAHVFYKEKTELIQKLGIVGIIAGIVILSAV